MLFIYREVLPPEVLLLTLVEPSSLNAEVKRITVKYAIELTVDFMLVQRGSLGMILRDPPRK